MALKPTQTLLLTLAIALGGGCVSMSEDEPEIPEITEDMEPDELFSNGVEFGGGTLDAVKEQVKKRQLFEQIRLLSEQAIMDRKYEKAQLWRVVHLYQATSPHLVSPQVVEALIKSREEFSRQMGWILAANRPSDIIALVIERHINLSLLRGREESLYLPEMALAVKANELGKVYGVLVQGLLAKGGPEFVEAMVHLNPARARYDVMDYLSLATVEDLRQLNQTTVDLHTCIAILEFLNAEGVPLEHPRFEHLFLYAISRNHALADLANSSLQGFYSLNRDQMVFVLSRLPVWVQLAFVEGSRSRMTAPLGLFLQELKQVTAHKEVLDEIDALTL